MWFFKHKKKVNKDKDVIISPDCYKKLPLRHQGQFENRTEAGSITHRVEEEDGSYSLTGLGPVGDIILLSSMIDDSPAYDSNLPSSPGPDVAPVYEAPAQNYDPSPSPTYDPSPSMDYSTPDSSYTSIDSSSVSIDY